MCQPPRQCGLAGGPACTVERKAGLPTACLNSAPTISTAGRVTTFGNPTCRASRPLQLHPRVDGLVNEATSSASLRPVGPVAHRRWSAPPRRLHLSSWPESTGQYEVGSWEENRNDDHVMVVACSLPLLLLSMSKPQKPAKKHHFVPQAQLRHFAPDAERRSVWVFDKQRDRAWISSILNAGSENDFNSVDSAEGRWSFEDAFRAVDGRSAALVGEMVERRSVGWFAPDDRDALVDLFATQILRTSFARTSPRLLAAELRELVRDLGHDPDGDPALAMPTDAALRVGALRSFLERQGTAQAMRRLVPAMFAAGTGRCFVLSDDPVAIANAFPYGDAGLKSHGIVALLPIAPTLAVALVCPTVVARFEASAGEVTVSDRRLRLARYRDGFRTGDAFEIVGEEADGWNKRQVSCSAKYLYAATDDFDFARRMLEERPDLRRVETHVRTGRLGSGLPRRAGMPSGLQMLINGVHDHCILPITEFDEAGEGMTARTSNLILLELVAKDAGDLRAELHLDGEPLRYVGAAQLERFGEPTSGWFRVVHRNAGEREMARIIDFRSHPVSRLRQQAPRTPQERRT